ncbi:hypothetical protein CDAR_564311 [Caerostris darwini]|uniref:Uncharacterized protein n=1 Tax=Caerostris darwini TaxID=1538125 RepID=A0AAV4VIZ3_9ARAC|nr:hypothetical protein CDAR_564311 [Caerostris darwini]
MLIGSLAFKRDQMSSIQTHVAWGSSRAIKSFILKITATPFDKLDFAAACLLFQKNSRAQLPLTPSSNPPLYPALLLLLRMLFASREHPFLDAISNFG